MRPRQQPAKLHRGRVWRNADWWRYRCTDCNYGAGSRDSTYVRSAATWSLLMSIASDHASPEHWSRHRGY